VCTGLSGVLSTCLRQRSIALSTLATCPRLLGNCHQATPDCPVRHRTVQRASHVPQPTVGHAINAGHVSSATVIRLHLTVRYATGLYGVLATCLSQWSVTRSTLATSARNCHQAAPDCPVHHRTIWCAKGPTTRNGRLG
jgi:hypothetical protein